MKPVKIRVMLQMLRVLALSLVVVFLFAGSARAQDPTAPSSSAAPGVSGSDPASKWMGAYDPFSRGCMPDVLTMYESTFSWMDCKTVKIRVTAVSDTELAFEVDPNAKCSLAGGVVALTTPSPGSRAVDVTTYRSLIQYETKAYDSFCAYVRRSIP